MLKQADSDEIKHYAQSAKSETLGAWKKSKTVQHDRTFLD